MRAMTPGGTDGGIASPPSPLCFVAEIGLAEANSALARWGHRIGTFRRPNADVCAHGYFERGQLTAVTITSALPYPTCARLTRQQAVELARLCAARPGVCRIALRLWRDLIFPALAEARGYQRAVSYQDERLHNGDTYRFDGWIRLARSHSGPDRRSGRSGRDKTIWGWHEDADIRRAVRESGIGALSAQEAA